LSGRSQRKGRRILKNEGKRILLKMHYLGYLGNQKLNSNGYKNKNKKMMQSSNIFEV
jgi:hypothetical protein